MKTRSGVTKTAVVLAAWLAGCAPASETGHAVGCGWTPDPELHGAHLDNESNQPWAKRKDIKTHVRKTIEAAADYWGQPYDVLYGWKIKLVSGTSVDCYGFDGAGCTNWLTMTITIETGTRPSFEATSLLHEMGHVVMPLGDPAHFDDKWHDQDALADTYNDLMAACTDEYCWSSNTAGGTTPDIVYCEPVACKQVPYDRWYD